MKYTFKFKPRKRPVYHKEARTQQRRAVRKTRAEQKRDYQSWTCPT